MISKYKHTRYFVNVDCDANIIILSFDSSPQSVLFSGPCLSVISAVFFPTELVLCLWFLVVSYISSVGLEKSLNTFKFS